MAAASHGGANRHQWLGVACTGLGSGTTQTLGHVDDDAAAELPTEAALSTPTAARHPGADHEFLRIVASPVRIWVSPFRNALQVGMMRKHERLKSAVAAPAMGRRSERAAASFRWRPCSSGRCWTGWGQRGYAGALSSL